MTIQRILIIDDDPLSREFLEEAASSLGYATVSAPDGETGLARLAEEPVDLVLTDLRMPGVDGIEVVGRAAELAPEVPVVVVTAHGTIETAIEAMRRGATDFLLKPCTPATLEMVLGRIDSTQRLRDENRYLRSELVGEEPPAMIAKGPAMMEILRTASRIARSKGTVLITGESGTGKERIAHYVHQNSPRRDGPFIRVNCAALSEQLLESELFGHEKGAFTGAHKQRRGRFELADHGTLLLDEIGEISPGLQAKLLRVLEEEEFERVGGNTTLKVDVRVIATTNRDLPREIAEGRFREDLYYRLHVLPIHLPALRERPEDVIPLARHFVEVYGRRNGRENLTFSPEALERLVEWDWPGNVRELENVVQRAVVLASGDRIEAGDLAFGPSAPSRETEPEAVDPEQDLARRLANKPVADIERWAILATLECTGGNKTEAARRLGLTARTLSNKMKAWKQAGLVA